MANGTTLFFHKCDSYFCALPNPFAGHNVADRFISAARIHALVFPERACSFVLGVGVMICQPFSTFIIKGGFDKSWNSLRLAVVRFGFILYGSDICRMADRISE